MIQQRNASDPTIRFANFLSPLLQQTYEHIATFAGMRLEVPTVLGVGQTLEEFERGQTDVGFLCGLLYVQMRRWPDCPIEVLAAPVLQEKRYLGLPIYFSDVIVRRDSPYTTFDDLQGCVWAYNERASHSGCNIVCYSLLEREKAPDYFGKTVKSGSHLSSLRMVLDGRADATAIDSHVFAAAQQREPQLAEQLRVIDAFGPSAMPPVVVAKRLDDDLKRRLQNALVTMHTDPAAAAHLREGLIERFVPVTDDHYDDMRAMLDRVQTTQFPFE